MYDFLIDFFKELLRAWREGALIIRRFLVVGAISATIGISAAIVNDVTRYYGHILEPIAVIIGVTGAIFGFGVFIYRKSLEDSEREQRIEEVEQRVKENPKETQAAWELARVKLESYLNRDLKQVRSIFWLTVLVMLVGFALIGFGVYSTIESPDKLAPAIISSVSGVLVNFYWCNISRSV